MIGNFYITDNKREILIKFKEKAEENGVSYSKLIVKFIEDYIKENSTSECEKLLNKIQKLK